MSQDFKKQVSNILQHTEDDSSLIKQLKNLLDESEISGNTITETKSALELYNENIDSFNSSQGQENLIKTLYGSLDDLIGGFVPGELVVVGARPSMGKTQLLINLCLNFSKTLPVLYFTFDLSDNLLTNRFVSTLSSIPINRILQRNLLAEEKQLLSSYGNYFAEHKIYINGGGISSLSQFRNQCLSQIESNGIKVIFVDFLQMITSNKYRGNREQEVSNFSRELKSIAKQNNVLVVAASQLSRSLEYRKESKVPQLSDLRESGSIEQDADKVIFLFRPEYYGINNDEMGELNEGETHLCLAKNKIGKTGVVKIKLGSNNTSFVDMESDSRMYIPNEGFRTVEQDNRDFNFSKNRINELNMNFKLGEEEAPF